VVLALLWLWTQRGAVRPIPVGQPLRVTSADAWEGEPALSPDRGRIAYTSEEPGNADIHVVDVRGGNPLRVTTDPARDYDPAWYPDGNTLAFTSDRGEGTSIWKTGQLGGGATLLVPHACYPAISPDGKHIAFSRPSATGDLRIGTAPLEAPTRVTMLTGDDDGLWNHRYPAWSPDGRTICYSTQHNLWVVLFSGGRPRQLTTGGVLDSAPAWSSDGRHVYFSSYRGGTLALWRVGARGGSPERLTIGTGQESHPSVSRDGSRLAYSTQTVDHRVVVRDLLTAAETELTQMRDADMPSLAPDKSQIVFVSERWGPDADLWVQPLERGQPSGPARRVTEHPGSESHPTFSPDGEWVAYYRIVDEQRDIWTISMSSGHPIQFTDHPATDIHPAWSPDGSMLAFVSERDGGSHVWVAAVDQGMPAGPPRRLTGEEVSAFAPAWSPDGKSLAFVGLSENRLEAWAVPTHGDAPPRQVTVGADAQRVRWDPSSGALFVCGRWGEDRLSIRRVSLDGGRSEALDPPLICGTSTSAPYFDVSQDGRLLLFTRESRKGDIWVLEADESTY